MGNAVYFRLQRMSRASPSEMNVENLQLNVANTTATLKNGVFWDVTLCGSCKN
jgi:hypothetical protein